MIPFGRTYSFLYLLIIIGTFYVYSGSLDGHFIWDDAHFILRNPAIRSVEKIPEYFISKETVAGVGEFFIYRPLRNVSYLIDYTLYGTEPLGFRVSNLFLHFQNILLLAYLANLLTGSRFISALSAALFALHPVQTEAVSWIKGRDDLLATFFYLASITLYIKGRTKQRYLFYCGSILSFAIALLSKESAATLPLLIILYNIHFPEEDNARKNSYHPYFYLLLLYALLRTAVLGRMGQTEYWGGSFISAFYTNLTGIVYYIKLLFFPVNLCADYLMFPVRNSFLDPYVLGALAAILTLLVMAAVFFLKGWRVLSFSIMWFFLTLLPVSNIIPIKIIIAERFLYLPSTGVFIGAAVVLSNIADALRERFIHGNKIVISLVTMLLLFLASMTVDRNHVWTNDHTFWMDVVDKSPGNTRAWHNLATIYQNQRRLTEAISLYQKALMMEYHSPETHYQLGRVYYVLGKHKEALKEFFEALKDDPENADINYEVGFLLAREGLNFEAIFRYRKALASNPDHMDALYGLGMLYMKEGEFELAALQFKKILIIEPGDEMAAGFLSYCERKARES